MTKNKSVVEKLIDHFDGIQAAAAHMGVSRQSVYKWLWSGVIPPTRALQAEQVTGGTIKALDILRANSSKHRDNTIKL